MTNDYKKDLLDYITELQPGTPTTEERIEDINEIVRTKWTEFIPSNWSNFRIEGLLKSKTSDKVIFYGGYVLPGETAISGSRGIIIITDTNLNPLKTIYQYNSGTYLRPIQCLYQEEDGEFIGVDSTIQYVGIDYDVLTALMTNQKRVIMLNDFSIPFNEDYEIRLRTSYILGGLQQNFICRDIYKNPTTAHYSFMGIRIVKIGSSNPNPAGARIIQLKINVGSANEWGQVDSDNGFIYGGGYTYFDSNDNANWKCLLTSNDVDSKIYYWYGSNSSVSGATVIFDPNYSVYIDTVNYNNQVAFIDENTAYFVLNNQQWGISGTPGDKYIGLYKVNFNNLVVSQHYLEYLGSYDYCNKSAMYLQNINGELYVSYCDNVSGSGDTTTCDYYIQRYKGIWQPILVKESGKFLYNQRMFYISQTFNLLEMYLFANNFRNPTWEMIQITEVYNLANYNGESYEGYNSLIAKYGNIYSNDKIVFSRNLHNLTITNNYSVASIEVPNTYLNDITLTLKELVGETNTTLVQDGRTVVKNIYEVLYLNYINTLRAKDNDNNFLRDLSRYINVNINTGTSVNQNNSKCNKVCINYNDSSNKIFPIGWTSVDSTHKYTKFTIYVDKEISSIELISNDQSTTYLTIQRELEVGKYYTFKQYLKVE